MTLDDALEAYNALPKEKQKEFDKQTGMPSDVGLWKMLLVILGLIVLFFGFLAWNLVTDMKSADAFTAVAAGAAGALGGLLARPS